LLTVTIQAPESPALVLTEDPRISVISSRGPKPSITVSQQFLSVLTDDELTFALAHEMAHFALLHHGLLQSQGRGLSAFRDSPQPLSADQRRQLHHDMEFQADALAMEWMRALGLPSQASVETLKKAYGKAAGSSPTHPSLQQRAQRLTELFN
jgi:Zn-dependent protease with chaperone function